MRFTTWNVNSLRLRVEHLAKFAKAADPDVLCLQELKLTQEAFPEDAVRALFPHVEWWGQQAYNGVALLSKHPLGNVRRGFVQWGSPTPYDPESRVLSADVGERRVYGLYVPNGQQVGAPKFFYKLAWLGELRRDLDATCAGRKVVLLGDFNVALDDLDVWDPFKCDGQILCHDKEREALRNVLAFGFVDPFREKNPYANEFTWWDYQKMGFQRNHGLRIDHTFVTAAETVRKVTIHRDVRGWENPSDHAPVSVDVD